VKTYNAALNRTAYQSSVHSDQYGTFPASCANDGSRHTDYSTNPHCAVTNQELNPWWAVDLGQPTTIYGVDLTTSLFSCTKNNFTSLDVLDLEIIWLALKHNCVYFYKYILWNAVHVQLLQVVKLRNNYTTPQMYTTLVATLTPHGHVTSSVTWTFDSHYLVSCMRSIDSFFPSYFGFLYPIGRHACIILLKLASVHRFLGYVVVIIIIIIIIIIPSRSIDVDAIWRIHYGEQANRHIFYAYRCTTFLDSAVGSAISAIAGLLIFFWLNTPL